MARPGADEGLELTALHAPGLLWVFEQICLAVGYAHSRNIIHRDLKPANVMLGAFGEVQVMDWGLAREMTRVATPVDTSVSIPPTATDGGCEDTGIRLMDDTEQSRLGQALGTPAFMPPEQGRGDWEHVDARADVFALGGILCVILTGHPPYAGRTLVEVVHRAVNADLAEAFGRLDASGADPALIALAKRCMAANPEERLPHGMAVVAALQAHRWDLEERLGMTAGPRIPPAVHTSERTTRRQVGAKMPIRAT